MNSKKSPNINTLGEENLTQKLLMHRKLSFVTEISNFHLFTVGDYKKNDFFFRLRHQFRGSLVG